ncbi:hypothetical protein [Mycoplasmopsis arginini]|uniref:Uncharacterized protein n=2 Tax=Mycoplasmopsis arginini TaxID=2094 RepID=A0AA43TW94_MYCAR|nr:hypothetical protein [Mycoplasmopsis arginini]MCY2902846.1 hypothetical protein [Mycoplasmopsis arginini QMP CG1-2758]MDI3349583.1 hypothetical protein [Mycoplasmopsis arginini]MDI3350051.1 hypothetical protein [Mycoplasmopsis arginini]MDI3350628.1 hypothetical protein [Mycoplasmopsis arginini]MDI3352433.1 hypothetical protein [Mycoplasmopsis arginini]
MSNNKKWKNKKININNYQTLEIRKERKTLSNSWRIALTGLFLIAIPSFVLFILLGRDGWAFSNTKNLGRWDTLLPITFLIVILQTAVVSLLVFKFKVFGPNSFIFLVPFAIAMASFLVSSGIEDWPYRVMPAVGLAFLSLPLLLLVKHIDKKKKEKQRKLFEEEERTKKSLLD